MFSEEDDAHNPLHGSATLEEAEKELQYFFPKEKTLAVIKPNAIDSRGKHTHYKRLHIEYTFAVSSISNCVYRRQSWCVIFVADFADFTKIGSALLLSTVEHDSDTHLQQFGAKTLAISLLHLTHKCDCLCFTADAIMEKIKEAGFNISLSKETTLTKEMAEQLYSEHKGKDFFEDLTGLMSKYAW